jgi:1-acyl-sn-glycerol-3-phosphate acyltransferase
MVSFAISFGLILRDPSFFHRMQRHWARGLSWFWGVDIAVFGSEHMQNGTSYVVMSNHASFADIVALFLGLPVIPGFLAKRELMRVPFLAAALRAGGHVIVDRGKRDSARQAIENAAAQVHAGKTVLIFPEGTRHAGGVGDFKRGGFHLAKSARVPIVPVGLRGTGAVGPRDKFLFWPGKVEVHIGAPILPEQIANLELDELMRVVREQIVQLSSVTPPHAAAQGEPAPA